MDRPEKRMSWDCPLCGHICMERVNEDGDIVWECVSCEGVWSQQEIEALCWDEEDE